MVRAQNLYLSQMSSAGFGALTPREFVTEHMKIMGAASSTLKIAKAKKFEIWNSLGMFVFYVWRAALVNGLKKKSKPNGARNSY